MLWRKSPTSSTKPKPQKRSSPRRVTLPRGAFLRIVGDSMTPTLRDGQIIFVNTRAFRRRAPQRGELVVARPAASGRRLVVKRLAGVPHDTVMVDGAPRRLQTGEFFLLGEHASASTDSRSFGPVRKRELLGPVRFSLWPWRRLRPA